MKKWLPKLLFGSELEQFKRELDGLSDILRAKGTVLQDHSERITLLENQINGVQSRKKDAPIRAGRFSDFKREAEGGMIANADGFEG